MAKGQQRSNREARKPKATKPANSPSPTVTLKLGSSAPIATTKQKSH
jgi:hypothetical protein